MDMSKQIRAIRQAAGLTQAAFGKRIGLSRDQIASLETGRTRRMPQRTVEHLFTVYNVNPNWLEAGKGHILLGSDDSLCRRANKLFRALSSEYREAAIKQMEALYHCQRSQVHIISHGPDRI